MKKMKCKQGNYQTVGKKGGIRSIYYWFASPDIIFFFMHIRRMSGTI